jgi:hypothetical protein
MQLKTIFLIVILFIIFSLTGYFLVNRYFSDHWDIDKYFTNDKNSQQIIFSQDNNLYTISPNISDLTKISKNRLQSTGKVVKMTYDRKSSLIYYESTNSALKSEIWQIDLNTNKSQLMFSSQTAGLENFMQFSTPVFSPDKSKLAFIGKLGSKDCVFTYDHKTKTLTNVSDKIYNDLISDLIWLNANTIIFKKENTLYALDLVKNNVAEYLNNSQKIKRIEIGQNNLLLLMEDEAKTANLFKYDGTNLTAITGFTSPKTVLSFAVSADFNQIAMEVNDTQKSASSIFLAKTNGENLLEITTKINPQNPVFAPSDDQIAVFVKNEGIQLINLATKKTQKIINEPKIDQIFLWK